MINWLKESEQHQHENGQGWIANTAKVEKTVYVGPNARVSGYAQVYGDARVYGYARVSGYAQVYGDAWVSGDAWKTTPLFVQGSKHGATNCRHGYIAIGCEVHTFAEWQANFADIGKKNRYTTKQIAEYKAIIELFVAIGK
jgi:hypothetical protein